MDRSTNEFRVDLRLPIAVTELKTFIPPSPPVNLPRPWVAPFFLTSIFTLLFIGSVNGAFYPAKPCGIGNGVVPGESLPSRRLLLFVSSLEIEVSHRRFISLLKELSFTVTLKAFSDDEIRITNFGVFLFDHIFIMDPEVDTFSSFLPQHASEILRFVDAGGNLLIAGSPHSGESIRQLMNQFSVDFDKPGSRVRDHFGRTEFSGKDIIGINPSSTAIANPFRMEQFRDHLVYRGIGHLANPSNTAVTPILRGTPTCYSAQENESAGEEILLISSFQAMNGARVILSGSAEMFSDDFFQTSGGTNEAFSEQLVKWMSGRMGVLRWSNLRHYVAETGVTPNLYQVRQKIVFSVDIHQLQNQKWVPLETNDIQIELIRMDTVMRRFLNKEGATFTASFNLPDELGVFKIVLSYRRPGYNHLHLETLIPVRDYRHDGFERFLTCALPYYGSTFASLLSVAFFILLPLYHKNS